MEKEKKSIFIDEDLNIDIARYSNIVGKNFFRYSNDKYTVGFLEKGTHYIFHRKRKFLVDKEDFIILNPKDYYSFSYENKNEPLSYLSISIPPSVIKSYMDKYKISSFINMPYFENPVAFTSDIILKNYIMDLYSCVENNINAEEKEQLFLKFLSHIIKKYSVSSNKFKKVKYSDTIELVCEFMSKNFSSINALEDFIYTIKSDIDLEEFIDVFTITKRFTPYRYLENIRLNNAKKLIENGMSSPEAAEKSGFSSRVYFNKIFFENTGITAREYSIISKKIK